jgi:hypothetical protein
MFADGYRYKLVTANVRTLTLVQLILERGHKKTGVCNRRGVREELRGQPEFSGLLGPMFDGYDDAGNAVIRYEDQSTYELLST